MTATAIVDPARLARALALSADPLPSGGWLVGSWLVDREDGCTCPDRRIRGPACKHEIRVRLAVLDDDLLAALRELVPDLY